jgi:hypothetical protein
LCILTRSRVSFDPLWTKSRFLGLFRPKPFDSNGGYVKNFMGMFNPEIRMAVKRKEMFAFEQTRP